MEEIKKDKTEFNEKQKYQSAIGGLIYLANSYRPDIATAVGLLSSFNVKPNLSAWKYVMKLYGYLLHTKDLKLVYKKPKEDAKLKIEIYVDANFNDPELKSKSRSGYLIYVDGCLIGWYSKKQTLLASSTEEAEVFSANEGAKSILWLIKFFDELNFDYEMPKMYEDNSNAILWIKERKTTMRTRHFDLRLELIREMIDDNLIQIEYVKTEENPADIMTKVLGRNKHEKFLKMIGLE
jgi:hypothetical protein